VQRDILILQRRAQGWSWAEIAAGAGLSERGARLAAEKRRTEKPLAMGGDPVKIVEDVMLGLQLSIGRFEEYAERWKDKHPSASAGAAKAADDARLSVLALLQAVGRLPEDLIALRQVTEQRAMATTVLDSVELFSAQIADLDLPPDMREKVAEATAQVMRVFYGLLGLPESVAPLAARALPAPPE
jgi:hypothetical protein